MSHCSLEACWLRAASSRWDSHVRDRRAAEKLLRANTVGGWRLIWLAQNLRSHHQVHLEAMMALVTLLVKDLGGGGPSELRGDAHVK